MAKDILCAFGVDVDAVAGWLGSYGGEDSPDDISRGLFAGEIGAPRLLKLFEDTGVPLTVFAVAMAAQAMTPAAGPDSAVFTGSSQAVWRDITPPLLCTISSSPSNPWARRSPSSRSR